MKLTTDKLNEISSGIIYWIRNNMAEIGAKKAVIGVSGGKDSTVTASLCALAIGPENVHGLIMPDGDQEDLKDAIEICEAFEINYSVIDISKTVASIKDGVHQTGLEVSRQTILNIPPRVRMTTLYAYAQSLENALVINTSNLSEDWVGYATVYGDTAGAFSPLATLTSDEVIQIGRYLGIEEKYIVKPPADGLTGKTDEEILGFTYEVLNKYLRTGKIEDQKTKETIDRMHRISRFKFNRIPMYNAGLKILANEESDVYSSLE